MTRPSPPLQSFTRPSTGVSAERKCAHGASIRATTGHHPCRVCRGMGATQRLCRSAQARIARRARGVPGIRETILGCGAWASQAARRRRARGRRASARTRRPFTAHSRGWRAGWNYRARWRSTIALQAN